MPIAQSHSCLDEYPARINHNQTAWTPPQYITSQNHAIKQLDSQAPILMYNGILIVQLD